MGRGTAQKNVYWEGGHCTYFLEGRNNWGEEKTYTERGGHHTFFVDGGTIKVGTQHNVERIFNKKNLYGWLGGWVDGWVGGWVFG